MSTIEQFAPDATAESVTGGVSIGGERHTCEEARRLGFVPESSTRFTRTWVQASGFMVRGLIRRGDAQKFDAGELRELVRGWLAERGVEFEHPGAFDAVCFNYQPNEEVPIRP